MVILVAVIFAIIGFGILSVAENQAVLGRIENDKTRAFYLAEAGLAKMAETLQNPVLLDEIDGTLEGSLEQGTFSVVLDTDSYPCYAIATGTSGPVQRRIRVEATFLAAPFENAIYAMNSSEEDWALQLRGKGNPVSTRSFPYTESGGKDIISGNIVVHGDVYMYEQSRVNPAPTPNTYNLAGDVGATGSISVLDSSHVSGDVNPDAEEPDPIDLTAMDYAHNNTHNVSQIFQDAGVSSGYLPNGSELRNVFVKNPSDRGAECAGTTGDDFFFEPSAGFVVGGPKSGDTPLDAGNDKVYYIDGDLWVHSLPTYGFKMNGKVTIITTGDIHICDNLEYANDDSLLGLVALGKHDDSGQIVSGGNIYFGDPVQGVMGIFSAMMYAGNDFLFNTDPITRRSAEPDSGFIVNGSFAAAGQVNINRDWYDKSSAPSGCKSYRQSCWSNSECCSGNCSRGRCSSGSAPTEPAAAEYNPTTDQWYDAETGNALNSDEIDSLRHYQMIVNYDERVRNSETCPPGLPRGGSKIFAGFSNWEEL